jgi:hypothetical protein
MLDLILLANDFLGPGHFRLDGPVKRHRTAASKGKKFAG